MANRADWRASLEDHLVGLEDSGYGDFEYEDSELNTYLSLAVARLFPALYKKASNDNLTVSEYGTNGYGKVTVTSPERVYLVEDATELTPIFGWQPRATTLVGISVDDHPKVNVYYYTAHTLPSDDTTVITVPDEWKPVAVLGALILALESRQDSGVRGDPPPTGQLHEVSLLDRLTARYERAREDLALTLPVVMS